uniref:Uncharacterized protein n=1 Tax=Mesocestoides corti TaxID=53468 RepID=A0A5K3FCV0_MESCO
MPTKHSQPSLIPFCGPAEADGSPATQEWRVISRFADCLSHAILKDSICHQSLCASLPPPKEATPSESAKHSDKCQRSRPSPPRTISFTCTSGRPRVPKSDSQSSTSYAIGPPPTNRDFPSFTPNVSSTFLDVKDTTSHGALLKPTTSFIAVIEGYAEDTVSEVMQEATEAAARRMRYIRRLVDSVMRSLEAKSCFSRFNKSKLNALRSPGEDICTRPTISRSGASTAVCDPHAEPHQRKPTYAKRLRLFASSLTSRLVLDALQQLRRVQAHNSNVECRELPWSSPSPQSHS